MPSRKFIIISIILIIALLYGGYSIDSKSSKEKIRNNNKSTIQIIYPENNKIINFDRYRTRTANPELPFAIEEPTNNIFFNNEFKDKLKINSAAKYTCPIPLKDYGDMWLLNVNQNVGLPDITYIPNYLEKISNKFTIQNNICLVGEAKNLLESMIQNADKNGIVIRVSSGFRTSDVQQILLNNSIKSGNLNANIAIAKAGYSEHQLGTTVDLTGSSINYASASSLFDQSKEAIWLEENASLYGFIRSYPIGKESITGYMYEPWHYRYVGIDNAKQIKKNNETINEFLTRVKK